MSASFTPHLNISSFKEEIFQILDPFLIPPLNKIVQEYIELPFFGASNWKEYLGVQVEEVELDQKFYDFWYAHDVVDPTQLNCETHLPPILRPSKIQNPSGGEVTYNVNILKELMQKPLKGNSCELQFWGEELPPLGSKSSYVVARKQMLQIRLPYVFTGESDFNRIKCTEKLKYQNPSVLNLCTVALIHYLVTKESYFGTQYTKENRFPTWSLAESFSNPAKEIAGHRLVGNFRCFSETAQMTVFDTHSAGSSDSGVMVVREFACGGVVKSDYLR